MSRLSAARERIDRVFGRLEYAVQRHTETEQDRQSELESLKEEKRAIQEQASMLADRIESVIAQLNKADDGSR